MHASSGRPLALVTGGSSGIGRELARQFALHGFDLVIGGSSDRVEEAAAALRLNGAAVVPVRSDLATYDGVEAAWKAVQETGRPLAAAALNAGIGGDRATRRAAVRNKFLPERVKTHRQAQMARPS